MLRLAVAILGILGFAYSSGAQSPEKVAERDRARREAPASEQSPQPPPACGPNDHPVLLSRPAPRYPPYAYRHRIGGVVQFDVLVGADGSVQEARLVSTDDAQLTAAARDSVMKGRYCPAVREGTAVPMRIPMKIMFALPKETAPAPRP